MNMHLYPKLAWHGIIKNKKTYVPFLLTSIGLVMMFYIVSYLTYNKSVKQMRGGGDMQLILSWGVPVVAFFCCHLSVLHEFVPHASPENGVRTV